MQRHVRLQREILRLAYSAMGELMAILSPAKSMEMEYPTDGIMTSKTRLQAQTKELAGLLQAHSARKLQSLMSISEKLADLNADRWQKFNKRSNPKGPAAICFRGDVYQGLEAWTLDRKALAWAQDHLRIISGLFGLLRPLDSIQPYRLEMNTPLKTKLGKDLYCFWGNSITKTLGKDIREQGIDTLLNLASDEYSRALDMNALNVRIIQARFLQIDKGKAKFISFYAKQARGLMARWMAIHKPKRTSNLMAFNLDGYRLDPDESGDDLLIFTRPKPAPVRATA